MQEVIGAASLEAADRVDRLDLEHGGDTGAGAERLTDELRRVQKGRVDHLGGFANSLDRDGGIHDRQDIWGARSRRRPGGSQGGVLTLTR